MRAVKYPDVLEHGDGGAFLRVRRRCPDGGCGYSALYKPEESATAGRSGVEKPCDRHRGLLRARFERPRRDRTANKRNELAPSHLPPKNTVVQCLSLALCYGTASEKGQTIGPRRCDPMYSSGHLQTSGGVRPMSAVPPKADIDRPSQHVRFVPQPDSCTAAIAAPFGHLVGAAWAIDNARRVAAH